MRMDRLTNLLMQALQDAQSLALSLDHNEMSPWHLLKALLTQSGGSARALVLFAGGHFDQLLAEVDRALDGLAQVANHDGEVRMSQDLARQFNLAEKQSMAQKDAYLSSETVLAVMSKTKRPRPRFGQPQFMRIDLQMPLRRSVEASRCKLKMMKKIAVP